MSSQVLVTKLFIPALRQELVPRPRLIEHLDKGLNRKLTLISAPAGFGKTTLVIEWLKKLQGDIKKVDQIQNKVAWLSLDDGDNDPIRFLTYFTTALRKINEHESTFGEGLLNILQAPHTPPIETILITLINEIATIPEKIIFVLDDYHLIDSQPIHRAMDFLVENLPPQLHLLIITREDPLLSLPRLRTRGQLNEIRATELRFTTSEVSEFLNHVMKLKLSNEDVTALDRRTEGWIAGLQLAAISMQGQTDISKFVKSFSGSHRLVLDYLIEEVLNQQPKGIQNFLLQTSILDQLNGSLCDALTSEENGQQVLESLEHANLFIIPLDDERNWYRYHHLFADLLRQRLKQTQPERISSLHQRASDWCELNGFTDKSIDYALRVKDFERAMPLIGNVAESLWWGGGHTKLRNWLDMLPDKYLITNPNLCIYQSGFLFSRGMHDEAERYLQETERILYSNYNLSEKSMLKEPDKLTDLDKMLLGKVAATRSFMASYRSDANTVIPQALQALKYLPEKEPIWRGSAAAALGDAYIYQGRYDEAQQVYFEALNAIKPAANPYQFMNVSLKLALNFRAQGKLSETIQICQQQLELAIENGMTETEIVGWMYAIWGEALAEINDLERAIEYSRKGVSITKRGGDVAMLTWCYLSLTRILFSMSDIAGAEEVINRTLKISKESNIPSWVTNMMASWQVRVWLVLDRSEKITQWMLERELESDNQKSYIDALEYIALARILIARKCYDDASKLLEGLLEQGRAGGHTTRVIEILILKSLTFQAVGDQDKAFIVLEQALTLAKPGGFIRIFIDEGPPMARLLYEALSHEIEPDYIQRLLKIFSVQDETNVKSSKPKSPDLNLIDPLSEREIEVLLLIAKGLSNQEIGVRLFLTLNTVKVHTRNIYNKLGVNSRTQAVAQAKKFGILKTETSNN